MDEQIRSHPNQWTYLASLQRMPETALETVLKSTTDGTHPLDLGFIDEEDLASP